MGSAEGSSDAVTRRTPLRVLDSAENLAILVYQLTQGFPAHERYGITSQMRRAAISVGSNLAEGSGRPTDADFARFVGQAEGSAAELQFQAGVSRRLGYLTDEELARLLGALDSMRRQMRSLRGALAPFR